MICGKYRRATPEISEFFFRAHRTMIIISALPSQKHGLIYTLQTSVLPCFPVYTVLTLSAPRSSICDFFVSRSLYFRIPIKYLLIYDFYFSFLHSYRFKPCCQHRLSSLIDTRRNYNILQECMQKGKSSFISLFDFHLKA